jgi:putative ABC transport system substrate-binding protein
MVPLAAETQQAGKKPRIGVPSFYDPPSAAGHERSSFWHAMHELGWVEGKTTSVADRYAEGRVDRLPALAAELVQLPVDVIVAMGVYEARAAKAASNTVPIVFTSAGEPVRAGLVESLARPGGNLTGVAILSPELSSKRLELLKAAVPGISRVAVLTNPAVTYLVPELEHAAQVLGIQLQVLNVGEPDGIERAFEAMREAHADALLVLSAPLFTWQRARLIPLAAVYRLPTMYPFRYFAAAGGLMAYRPSASHLGRRAAGYVDKILKGAKPADLPVETPMTFELVLNLKTAQALGLTMPTTLLFQATEVIR